MPRGDLRRKIRKLAGRTNYVQDLIGPRLWINSKLNCTPQDYEDYQDYFSAGFDYAGNPITIRNRVDLDGIPGPHDDLNTGYFTGSLWNYYINSTSNRLFVCVNASTDQAIWMEMGAPTGVTDTFQTADIPPRTATVVNGIITDIS